MKNQQGGCELQHALINNNGIHNKMDPVQMAPSTLMSRCAHLRSKTPIVSHPRGFIVEMHTR